MEKNGRIPTWTFADRLRKARREANLSQQELAKMLRVPLSTLSHWELAVAKPRQFIETCQEIGHMTGIDAGWLSGLVEPGPGHTYGNGQGQVGRPPQDRRVYYEDDSEQN